MGTSQKFKDLRKFGLVMSLPFGLIGGLLLWRTSSSLALPLLVVGALFFLLALLAPTLLGPVERFWMALALRISAVVTFVVLLVLYTVVFTPIALVLRLLRKDILNMKLDPQKLSYWVQVEPDGPGSRHFKPF